MPWKHTGYIVLTRQKGSAWNWVLNNWVYPSQQAAHDGARDAKLSHNKYKINAVHLWVPTPTIQQPPEG